MTNAESSFSGIPVESMIGAVLGVAIIGLCFFIFARTYWMWHMNGLRRQGFDMSSKKPTLFDVRELLVRSEKDLAVRVYRQIFKVDQKEAQRAVDALEKNMHKQG